MAPLPDGAVFAFVEDERPAPAFSACRAATSRPRSSPASPGFPRDARARLLAAECTPLFERGVSAGRVLVPSRGRRGGHALTRPSLSRTPGGGPAPRGRGLPHRTRQARGPGGPASRTRQCPRLRGAAASRSSTRGGSVTGPAPAPTGLPGPLARPTPATRALEFSLAHIRTRTQTAAPISRPAGGLSAWCEGRGIASLGARRGRCTWRPGWRRSAPGHAVRGEAEARRGAALFDFPASSAQVNSREPAASVRGPRQRGAAGQRPPSSRGGGGASPRGDRTSLTPAGLRDRALHRLRTYRLRRVGARSPCAWTTSSPSGGVSRCAFTRKRCKRHEMPCQPRTGGDEIADYLDGTGLGSEPARLSLTHLDRRTKRHVGSAAAPAENAHAMGAPQGAGGRDRGTAIGNHTFRANGDQRHIFPTTAHLEIAARMRTTAYHPPTQALTKTAAKRRPALAEVEGGSGL